MKLTQIIFVFFLLTLASHTAFGQGVVPPGTTEIGEQGTAANPIFWTLDGDFTAASDFTIGHSAGFNSGNYNILTVTDGQTFTAEQGFIVGPVASDYNCLDILAGAAVDVAGNMRIGTGNISYYSTDNKIKVAGSLTVGGDFNIGSRTAHSGVLSILNGGLVQVFGDFNLYSHWSYTNSWLELHGGILALAGDRTADFAQGSAVLASIKVWDDISGEFQIVADYDGQSNTTVDNAYSSMLNVEYIADPNDALFGYTVVNAVPEPTVMALFAFGAFVVLRRKKA